MQQLRSLVRWQPGESVETVNMVDYIKVTKDNAADILALLQ